MIHASKRKITTLATANKFSGSGHGNELIAVVGFDVRSAWNPTAAGPNQDIHEEPVPYPFLYREIDEVETFTVLTLGTQPLRKVLLQPNGRTRMFTLSEPTTTPTDKLDEREEDEIAGFAGQLVFCVGFDRRGGGNTKIVLGSRDDVEEDSSGQIPTSNAILSVETLTVLTVKRNPVCKLYKYPDGSEIHYHIP